MMRMAAPARASSISMLGLKSVRCDLTARSLSIRREVQRILVFADRNCSTCIAPGALNDVLSVGNEYTLLTDTGFMPPAIICHGRMVPRTTRTSFGIGGARLAYDRYSVSICHTNTLSFNPSFIHSVAIDCLRKTTAKRNHTPDSKQRDYTDC